MTVITAVVGTAVTLAKMVESKYQQELADLKKLALEREVKYDKDISELRSETKACQEDRYALAVRVASLESTRDILNQNQHERNEHEH